MNQAGRLGLAALLASAGPAIAQHSDSGPSSMLGSSAEEITSLALNLDNVVKLCTEESGRAAAQRDAIGNVEKRSLDAGMLFWMAKPPTELRTFASKGAARFGRWLDPHATIWVVAYEKYPSCQILVGDSPWTKGVRPHFYAKLQDDKFWKMEGAEEEIGDDQVRAVFYADLRAKSPVRPMITVTAPIASVDGGMQLVIGVHVVNKEEK